MKKVEDLTLKLIKDIIVAPNNEKVKQNTFYIPSYQRGYRWDKQQVEDLLNDIYEFGEKQKSKDEFYCLQPIVILKEKYQDANKEKIRYRVLDGQQRLTTIYIILKVLKDMVSKFSEFKNDAKYKEIINFCDLEQLKIPKIYSIEYETRASSKKNLEENISNGVNYTNPDFYYMSSAYIIIKEWFKYQNKKLFLDTILEKTKVIWYEVKADNIEAEIDVFTRLNMGKISLTNAELIKAMLLIPIKDYQKQIEFSTVWDKMELTLQNDEFWYFLSNDTKATTTIDLIFEVLAKQYNEEFKLNISKQDDKFSFYVFDKILKNSKKTANKIWEDTQKVYRYFIDWYNNREMYHKIGYLINLERNNKNKEIKYTLLFFIYLYRETTKNEFINNILKEIKITLQSLKPLDNLSYGNNYVNRVLLLFNLETILQNDKSNQRFQFDKYKNESWDIEHIASQTENINKKEWTFAILKYLYGIKVEKIPKEKFDKFIENKFDKFFERTKKIYQKDDENLNKDNIGNLALLNSKINRSYGNAFFPVKRAIILDKDSKNSFIPIATKNIFLKQYSKKLSDMMNWTNEDIENYRIKIYKLLKKYGVKNTEVKNG